MKQVRDFEVLDPAQKRKLDELRDNYAQNLTQDRNADLAPLAAAGTLDPYATVLDLDATRHLLRRTMLGAKPADITRFLGMSSDAAVDTIVNEALAETPPADPPWISELPPPWWASQAEREAYDATNIDRWGEYSVDWLNRLYSTGLRERLTILWQDHFVTSAEVYYHAQLMHWYLQMLRTHALGNFKDFVYDVGLNKAMLLYLNGVDNQKGAPNENYARELLELFTCGIVDKDGNANYTENDVKEISRCLTGYTFDWFQLTTSFDSNRFDDGSKTVFGQTGNYGYAEVLDVIFNQRGSQIAYYICQKLYQEFVYEIPNKTIIEQLATTLQSANWDLATVLRQLLKSQHFFDTNTRGARIASPIEKCIGFQKEVSAPWVKENQLMVYYGSWSMDQVPFLIASVNGWPRHRNWISTRTIPERWGMIDWMLWADGDPAPRIDLSGFVDSLVDTTDALVAFHFAEAVAELLMPVPVDQVDWEDSNEFGGDLVSNPIPQNILSGPPHVLTLTKMLLRGIPWYEWNPTNPDLDWTLRLFIAEVTRVPEFQLI